MLATVMALYKAAGLPIVPFLYGRRMEEVRKKLTVLVAMAMMVAMMAANAGVASAADTYKGNGNGYGWAKNSGGTFPGGGGGCSSCE
jgi:hypothetical protein